MRIEAIKIQNYRNFNEIEIKFHPKINFIVGENNLGKSNLLDCLDTIFNWRRFYENDFNDPEKAIEIFLSLKLEDEEIGIFADYFDPLDNNKINLHIIQEAPDLDLSYFHLESGDEISYTWRRASNFIKYSSLRSPIDELSFDKNRGVGKFLSYIVKKYLDEHNDEFDYVNQKEVDGLIEYINHNLALIEVFKEFSITADVDSDLKNLLYKMIVLKENSEFELKNIGHGIQFSAMVSLFLLEKIIKLTEYKKSPNPIFDKEDGSKVISAIMGLDEPEIHLHPYMQRSLTKYILSILKNNNTEFLELIESVFSLNGINGQAILVTHSPNVILNDYHQIIRFSKLNNRTSVVSGHQIELDTKIEKQFLRNMPYIKEAFFSRCVLLVEGDSELGALPLFADKMNANFDLNGINIVKADGKKSIPGLAKLLLEFKIGVCAIIDRDDKSYEFDFEYEVTKGRDFEEDLVNKLVEEEQSNILFEILEEYDSQGRKRHMQQGKLKKINNKYQIIENDVSKGYKFSDIEGDKNFLRLMFISWLQINKSAVLGRIIGEKVPNKFIPDKYKKIIFKALELSERAT